MSVLGKNALIELMSKENANERLFITPLLEDSQITESTIDIRLGNDFIVTKRGALASVDPASEINPTSSQSMHRNNLREKFYLHPNELVLANTLEYFCLPNTVSGYVTSRSSWGRAGLVIATATIIHPGFRGTITLELLNLGEVPMVLYPGLAVAQIALHECKGAGSYEGQFSNSTTTVGSKLNIKKSENSFWVGKDS